MNIDKQALRKVAEKAQAARARLESFPDEDGVLFEDDDIKSDVSACNKFFVLATPATMLALLDELEAETRYREGAFIACNRWHDKFREADGKLEAAERRIAEQSAIVATAEKLVRCKGRYHSELNYRALAKLFGVITPDLPPLEHENVHYADAAEVEITALRQRIAELEARTVTLPDRKSEIFWPGDADEFDSLGYVIAVRSAIRGAGIKVKG
ncbi:ead/Ea22-like family protein [Salmonella enterica subsp. diarizonae]|nr:ead/Ea22-like family protein [Salmonella enterica subsp. diarizonae]